MNFTNYGKMLKIKGIILCNINVCVVGRRKRVKRIKAKVTDNAVGVMGGMKNGMMIKAKIRIESS